MKRIAALLLVCLGGAFSAAGAMGVTLTPSVPSPQPAGNSITWTANATGADAADLVYRFRVRRPGLRFRTAIDYGRQNTFEWMPVGYDGTFEIEVAARSLKTGEIATWISPYTLESPAKGGTPVLGTTSHPLVLLYSAPGCDEPGRMKVRFQSADGVAAETPYRDCQAGSGMSFYLGGLRANTEYTAYHRLDTGDAFVDGPKVTATTGSLPDLPDSQVLQAAPANSPYPVLLQEIVFTNPIAVDLQGRIVWYLPSVPAFFTRPDAGGRFFGIVQDQGSDRWNRFLRVWDLTGKVVLQTNVARVNEQLAAMGKTAISSFHHEAMRLPEGRIAAITGIEKIVPEQGNSAVLGDGVVVMDEDLKVVWAWSAFDYLDVKRQATLGDVCNAQACPPTDLASNLKDWTHANSISQSPDGNLLVSIRNQDWIIKIDYRNGEGDGGVIWKLGKGGDFRLANAPDSGWFTHQHDPKYERNSTTRMMVYDNANTRRDTDPQALSRGQVYELDEVNRTATLSFSVDMPYSLALGSTQRLPNGNYEFVSGFLPDASGTTTEFTTDGKAVFSINTKAPVYRSYRLPSMYSSEP